jgi:tight adherence protein B
MTGQISATTALASLLGAGTGLGLLLIVLGSGWNLRVYQRIRTAASLDRRQALRMAAAMAAGAVIGVVTGWIVGAVLAGAAVWHAPRLVGRDREHAHRVARIEAIATWAEMLRDTLSAAAGLEQAILAVAPLAPPPIRREVTEATSRMENGQRLTSSLEALADQLADPTGDLVISALVLAAEHQARHLGDLLGSLAQAAREHASMRMRIEAGRARTRTSIRVIVGTTLGFALAVVLLNRPYLAAYDSTVGQLVLLGVGTLFALGIGWLTRIARFPAPPRLLSTEPDLAAEVQGVTP